MQGLYCEVPVIGAFMAVGALMTVIHGTVCSNDLVNLTSFSGFDAQQE